MKSSKKLIGILSGIAVFVSSVSGIFAKGPADYTWDYDLAVIANKGVDISGSVEVEGSIYSAEKIKVDSSDMNRISGSLIAGDFDIKGENKDQFEAKKVYNEDPEKHNCEYSGFDIPKIENQSKVTSVSEWGQPLTVSEDTYFKKLEIAGKALTIDVSQNDVTLVVDSVTFNNANIAVEGDNTVNLYIGNAKTLSGVMINGGSAGFWANPDNLNSVTEFMDQMGDADQFNLYLKGDSNAVNIASNARISANVFVDSQKLKIDGGAKVKGNITANIEDFDLNNSAYVRGTVCVPNADSRIHGTGTLIGQIHTDEIKISNNGRIYYGEGSANIKPQETPSPTPTAAPQVTPSPAPTQTPAPDRPDITLNDKASRYAYIFGYEPKIIMVTDENGETQKQASIQMAPDDTVTREQVCAMIARLVSQLHPEDVKDFYDISERLVNVSDWAKKGVGYICAAGAYDDLTAPLRGDGDIPRGEVAKLVVYGLNLQMKGEAKAFSDVDETTRYKAYIDIMTSNGYMQGDGDTFRSEGFMTRAEFCSMFNKVTGRESYDLTGYDKDGNVMEVTPETYYFNDMDHAPEWQVRECLLATSAFDENGRIDIETRVANIRNVVDAYDAQKEY